MDEMKNYLCIAIPFLVIGFIVLLLAHRPDNDTVYEYVDGIVIAHEYTESSTSMTCINGKVYPVFHPSLYKTVVKFSGGEVTSTNKEVYEGCNLGDTVKVKLTYVPVNNGNLAVHDMEIVV